MFRGVECCTLDPSDHFVDLHYLWNFNIVLCTIDNRKHLCLYLCSNFKLEARMGLATRDYSGTETSLSNLTVTRQTDNHRIVLK